jgi:hypothetical protein
VPENAEVVELVDTLCSGRSVLTGVGVQIPPSAENLKARNPRRLRAFFVYKRLPHLPIKIS